MILAGTIYPLCVLALYVFYQSEGPAIIPVSFVSSIALLAAAFASLFVLAIHFRQLREETPGLREAGLLRPLWGPGAAIGDSRNQERWHWSRLPVSVPRDFCAAWAASRPVPARILLRRALHWHAASQFGWNMLRQCVLAGVVMLGIAISQGARSLGDIASLLCLAAPLVGLIPAFAISLQPAVRARVASEFLRPFSRTEHVQAVALVLVFFLVAVVLEISVLPLAGFWLVASKPVWSQQPLWPLAAGLSAVPLFLGVGLANLREPEAFWGDPWQLDRVPAVPVLAASCEGKAEGLPLFGLCTLMAAIGCGTMRGALSLVAQSGRGMMGTVRKRRSRNSYREVLLTYCRGRFLLNAVVCVPFLCLNSAGVLRETQGLCHRRFRCHRFSHAALHALERDVQHFEGTADAWIVPGEFIVAAAWIGLRRVPADRPFLFHVGWGRPAIRQGGRVLCAFRSWLFSRSNSRFALILIYLLISFGEFRVSQIPRSLSWVESIGLCRGVRYFVHRCRRQARALRCGAHELGGQMATATSRTVDGANDLLRVFAVQQARLCLSASFGAARRSGCRPRARAAAALPIASGR